MSVCALCALILVSYRHYMAHLVQVHGYQLHSKAEIVKTAEATWLAEFLI